MMNWGQYGWGMSFGWIVMILFWVFVIYAVSNGLRALSRTTRRAGAEGLPLDILAARYAKGEISREEYERTVRDIGGSL